MPESFLQLPDKDRQKILTAAAQKLGRGEQILEKDVWVCWSLQTLLAMPDVPPLAFKGGTSLSKAYDAIARFSEDVDVTLDRQSVAPDTDPFAAETSAARTAARDALNEVLAQYIAERIKPHFDAQLRRELNDDSVETRIGDELWQLIIPYPSCVDPLMPYVADHVMLELGNRNPIEPLVVRALSPYIADISPDLIYPRPDVPVLIAERTFWEKATLIHMQCNRDPSKVKVNRLSRHWYDLSQLAEREIGAAALRDRGLLEAVVEAKLKLFYSASARYEDCLSGSMRLLPSNALAQALEEDFEEMRSSGMFWTDPASFKEILESLSALEGQINEQASAAPI